MANRFKVWVTSVVNFGVQITSEMIAGNVAYSLLALPRPPGILDMGDEPVYRISKCSFHDRENPSD